MTDFYINAFIALCGLLLHIAMKWSEARLIADGLGKLKPGIVGYIASVPAQTAIAIIAAVGSFTAVYAMDWLNPGMALACGYMGNSIAENLANRFAQMQ